MVGPLTLAASAAAFGVYGYRRPADLFRLAVHSRLRVAGFRSRRAALPDATISYWRGGRGESPLLFVHGFGTEAAVNWSAQLVACAPRFDAIAPDLPGFGASDRPQANNIAVQVQCLLALLDRLRLPRVGLIGHSMGGWISLAFASAFPERVDRLVVVDAAGLRFEPDLGLERALLPETIDDVRLLIEANFRRPPRIPAFVLRDLLRVARRDVGPRTALLERLVYGDEHVDAHLHAITAPTLVVWGRRDTLTPPSLGERLAAGIPDARLVVFEDAAHSPNVERPVRFNQLLLDFVSARDDERWRPPVRQVG